MSLCTAPVRHFFPPENSAFYGNPHEIGRFFVEFQDRLKTGRRPSVIGRKAVGRGRRIAAAEAPEASRCW